MVMNGMTMKKLLIAGIFLALSAPLASAAARIDLGDLGPYWIVQSNVMDEIWVPLKLTGVNYFAYGAPVKPNAFAARTDASSPLYQAWFGGYAINGGKEVFATRIKENEFDWFSKFAELDQISWLAAMGDPHPKGQVGTAFEPANYSHRRRSSNPLHSNHGN
jgi:hypothetical protein